MVFVRVAEYMLGDRAKSGETLVEAGSDIDMQIAASLQFLCGSSGKANDLRSREPCGSRPVLELKMCKILSLLTASFSRK